ncbi:ribonuclease P protein component [Patescibacteria group bacterium]|nr:ribonuclease P protein component [Patescibacteria group bacterium]
MFSQPHRLDSRTIKRIFKDGQRFFTPLFTLSYLARDELRVGIVIPKKVIPLRVHRNREKRRILHVLQQSVLTGNTGYYLFSLRHSTQGFSYTELVDGLSKVCSKVK